MAVVANTPDNVVILHLSIKGLGVNLTLFFVKKSVVPGRSIRTKGLQYVHFVTPAFKAGVIQNIDLTEL